MNTIFTVEDREDYNEKINLDNLYERKKQHDISTTNNYNKILNRIHNRIKTTSKLQINEHYCWFLVPEMMIGVPKFDVGTCIAYLIDKLQTNGFKVRYTHPNLLFISWMHWVPDYVRTEIKKKTGQIIDGHGNIVNKDDDINQSNNSSIITDPNTLLLKNSINKNKTSDNTKDINSYKPSGQLIYNNDIIQKLKNFDQMKL
jgi:hypothetical protein